MNWLKVEWIYLIFLEYYHNVQGKALQYVKKLLTEAEYIYESYDHKGYFEITLPAKLNPKHEQSS